jgi:elongator complex protein 3
MMPGLPGSDIDRDYEAFKTLFDDPRYRPDMLKIYPTLVIKDTKLYDEWRSGRYQPLTTEDAAELIARVKKITPPWIRIMRVQRDIPLPRISSGVDHSNLRQLAKQKLRESGSKCRCIRCREIGHSDIKVLPENIEIVRTKYDASNGVEEFITAEDVSKDVLVGLLRLRIPFEPFRPEIDGRTALVRELHVYGKMVPMGERSEGSWQHLGWGERLMAESEKIASDDYDMNKMVVMSALGTKRYYMRLGYEKSGVYVSKELV